VAYRAITSQQPQDKQLYQSHCWVTVTKKHVSTAVNQHNSGGTVGNGVFYSGSCRGVISGTELQLSSVGREPPLRGDLSTNRGIVIVLAITRQLLVKTL
jgi:hypothetical protein